MKAVLLAGGLGTRMREETEFRPKPMVEVGGRPVLWHIMKILGHYGISEFVVCTGYKSEYIKSYFSNYGVSNLDFTITLGDQSSIRYHGSHAEFDWQVTVADTGLSTMTGGRIKRIQKYIGDEAFLCTYGDGIADVDIHELIKFHRGHGKLATVTATQPMSRFGVIDLSRTVPSPNSGKSRRPKTGSISATSSSSRESSTILMAMTPFWKTSRCSAWPKITRSPRTRTTASGSRWIPSVNRSY